MHRDQMLRLKRNLSYQEHSQIIQKFIANQFDNFNITNTSTRKKFTE